MPARVRQLKAGSVHRQHTRRVIIIAYRAHAERFPFFLSALQFTAAELSDFSAAACDRVTSSSLGGRAKGMSTNRVNVDELFVDELFDTNL